MMPISNRQPDNQRQTMYNSCYAFDMILCQPKVVYNAIPREEKQGAHPEGKSASSPA